MAMYTKSVFIYDIKINPGVEFRHKPELSSGEFFMVLTDWTPSVGNPEKIITQLSPFGSWYPMRKDLFKVYNGDILCNPDYMREKLSASNEIDKYLALEEIKDAYEKGTMKQGIIKQKIRVKKGIQFLTGYFPEIGEIIFADDCNHPGVLGNNYSPGVIHGVGAYPWRPIMDKQAFINAF